MMYSITLQVPSAFFCNTLAVLTLLELQIIMALPIQFKIHSTMICQEKCHESLQCVAKLCWCSHVLHSPSYAMQIGGGKRWKDVANKSIILRYMSDRLPFCFSVNWGMACYPSLYVHILTKPVFTLDECGKLENKYRCVNKWEKIWLAQFGMFTN